MLVMVLLGLLIPLGVGVLALMELRTPPPSAVAVVQPLAETTVGISDSHAALAKADRLEVIAASSATLAPVSSEPPAIVSSAPLVQPALADERVTPSEGITTGSSAPPRVINRHRHDPKPRKVAAAAHPKPKPKATEPRRTVISERPKAASDTGPCRLSEFGGLRKALNSLDCEI